MAIDSRGDVGVFITPSTITAVQARRSPGRIEVVAVGAVDTPKGAMDGGRVKDPASVGQAIRGLLRHLNIRSRSVRVALSSSSYGLRALRFPEVPRQERRAMVRGEMEEKGTLPNGSDGFDFLWTPAPADSGRRQADAYVYYTGDAAVDSIRETIRAAGLRLEIVEPASLTLVRAYLAGNLTPSALLCPSKKHSDLCIFDGAHIRSLRRIPTGWDDFLSRPDIADYSETVMPSLSSPPPVGGRYDFSAEGDEAGGEEADWEIRETLNDAVSNSDASFLTSEVARSLAFFAREHPDASRPESLVILGPEDIVANMSAFLADGLSVPVLSVNPLEGFDMPAAQGGTSHDYLVAIGAAIGEAEGAVPALDLAQQTATTRTRRQAPVVLMAGMGGATAWMLLSIIAAIALSVLSGNATNESALITQEIKRIQDERAPLLREQAVLEATKQAQVQGQVPAASILGRVAAATPPGVTLTGLKCTADGKINVEGKSRDTDSMQRFARALGEGKVIKSPSFEMMKQDAKEGLTFRIVSRFRAPAPPATVDKK